MNRQSPAQLRGRRGVVLVAALVCLLVVMAMLSAMLLATLRRARQLHRERDLRQCEFLLRAGEDRALFQLASQADYRGETWSLPAASIVGSGDGQVNIEVSRVSDNEQPRITVVAEYPTGSDNSIRRSRTFSAPTKTPQSPE